MESSPGPSASAPILTALSLSSGNEFPNGLLFSGTWEATGKGQWFHVHRKDQLLGYDFTDPRTVFTDFPTPSLTNSTVREACCPSNSLDSLPGYQVGLHVPTPLKSPALTHDMGAEVEWVTPGRKLSASVHSLSAYNSLSPPRLGLATFQLVAALSARPTDDDAEETLLLTCDGHCEQEANLCCLSCWDSGIVCPCSTT